MMPVTSAEEALFGGDGFIVMKKLKARYDFALTPTIVVSPRDAAACFQKPVNTQDFLGAVQKALGQAAVPQGT
jgi:hypothetical protein